MQRRAPELDPSIRSKGRGSATRARTSTDDTPLASSTVDVSRKADLPRHRDKSTRPDGSARKPVRVREGYVPEEEVAKYRPRGLRTSPSQALRPTTVTSKTKVQPPPSPPEEKPPTTTTTTRQKQSEALDAALSKLSLGDLSSSRWAT
ncbi:hypothetical protein PYCC9005_001328 [Savitreella phatthalungensis]